MPFHYFLRIRAPGFILLTLVSSVLLAGFTFQKHSTRAALIKRCSKNIHQVYRRTPMPKYDFKATLLKSHIGMGVLL